MADQPAKSLQARHDREVRQVSPPRGRLQRALQRDAGPRGRPRRHERAPPGHPLEPDPRRGRDDRRQGLAPEGHRPRPRRRAQRSRIAAAAATRSRPSPATTPSRSTARLAARRCASALSVHADRGSIAVLPADAFTEPATKQAAEGLAKWGGELPALIVITGDEEAAAKSYRNLPRVSVVTANGVGVAEIIGHRSLIASEGALEVLAARAGRGRARQRRGAADEGSDD